jgi:hypothetical protein
VWPAIVALAWGVPVAEPAIPLRWEAPAECPDEAEVQRRAATLLTASAVDVGVPSFEASAHVEATADGYALELRISGGDDAGVRRLAARDCSELAQATALIVAIAIDPNAGASPPQPEPVGRASDPPPDPPPPPPPPIVADDEPAPTPLDARGGDRRDRARVRLALRGGAGMDVALWRPIGASVLLGIGVIGRNFRVDLLGRYAAPTTASTADDAIRASAQQWSVGVAGCWSPRFDRVPKLELPLCGGAEAGAMHAKGSGAALHGRHNRAPWIAASAGPGFAWVLDRRVAVWVSAEAVVLLAGPRFVTDRGTVVIDPRRAGFRALAGVELRFGAR